MKKKSEKKPLEESRRIQEYKLIYTSLRKLKLNHYVSLGLIKQIGDCLLSEFGINDNQLNIDYFWHRCPDCDSILKVNKSDNTRYCINKICNNYNNNSKKD